MNSLGCEVSQVWRGQGKSDFNRRISDLERDPVDDESGKEPNRYSSGY